VCRVQRIVPGRALGAVAGWGQGGHRWEILWLVGEIGQRTSIVCRTTWNSGKAWLYCNATYIINSNRTWLWRRILRILLHFIFMLKKHYQISSNIPVVVLTWMAKKTSRVRDILKIKSKVSRISQFKRRFFSSSTFLLLQRWQNISSHGILRGDPHPISLWSLWEFVPILAMLIYFLN